MFCARFEVRNERELLEDDGDAETPRIGRRLQPDRAAVDENLAGVGMLRAAQDAHQRGLAGAVLPEQHVHLAGVDRQRHVVERADSGERLGDPAHVEQGRHADEIIRARPFARHLMAI